MDNRLIPPSHFDPNERDSLENSRTSSPVHAFSMKDSYGPSFHPPVTSVQHQVTSSNIYLKSPGDFSQRAEQFPVSSAIKQGFKSMQGQNVFMSPIRHDTPAPNVETEHHLHLMKLQAENEALKSLIQSKTSQQVHTETMIRAKSDGCTMHEAVIEHQTTHIARLQKDIADLHTRLLKRENDVLQFENVISNKENDYKKKLYLVKQLESQIEAKDEKEEKLKEDISELQRDFDNLKKEKELLIEKNRKQLEMLEQTLKEEKNEALNSLKVKMKEEEDEHATVKLKWEELIKSTHSEYANMTSILKQSHEKEKEKFEKIMTENSLSDKKEIEKLMTELKDAQNQSGKLAEALTTEKSEKEDLRSIMNNLRGELSSSTQTCEKYLAQVSQLQSYIGEQQREEYERSQWKSNKMNLEKQIQTLQNEKQKVDETLELQTVRLQSITEILRIQEETINTNAKAISIGNLKGNSEHIVIKKWREKVFELMVQCKSNEISVNHIESKWKLAGDEIKDELQKECQVSGILENQLCDCRAQLEMLERENATLAGINKRLTETLNEESVKSSKLEELVLTISENVTKVVNELSQNFQSKFMSMMEKNIRFEQRITFANNRLRTINDLLIRKENVWKSRLRRLKEDKLKSSYAKEEKTSEKTENPDLISEISHLTIERDNLSQRLLKDSVIFENATTKFREREDELERNLSHVQHELQDKSEKVAELRRQLDSLEEKVRCCQETASDAKEEVDTMRQHHDEETLLKLSEARMEWETERREWEKKLNEARRELARTVVALRQKERNLVREKKASSVNIESMSTEYEQQDEKMRSKIKTLQQDNNLLMTILRQQGLISTFKTARSHAAKLHPETKVKREDCKIMQKDSTILKPNADVSADSKAVHFADGVFPEKIIPESAQVETIPVGTDGEPAERKKNEEHGWIQTKKLETEACEKVPDNEEKAMGKEGNVEEILKDLAVLTEEILGNSDED